MILVVYLFLRVEVKKMGIININIISKILEIYFTHTDTIFHSNQNMSYFIKYFNTQSIIFIFENKGNVIYKCILINYF